MVRYNYSQHMSEQDFAEWLKSQIQERDLSYNEFSKTARVGVATVSMVLSGKKEPGLSFLKRVAKALNMPIEDVLRRAGHMPGSLEQLESEDQTVRSILALLRQMSAQDRQNILEYIQLYQRQRQK